MKKLNIIQTPTRFYPYVGGVEKYVYDLSAQLVKNGHNVKVICANEPNKDIKIIDGIKVDKIKYFGKIANTNITLGLLPKLLKEEFDIIHTHIPTPLNADISLLASLIKRKPLILTYHNDILKSDKSNFIARLYNETFLKILLHKTKKIVITQPDYIKYSKYLKNHKHKITTVPVGINLSNFPLSKNQIKNKNQLFFLSVLDEHHRYKGLDYLLKTIKIVKKSIPNVTLFIGGNGELLNGYKDLVKKLDIEKNVRFLGYVPDNALKKFYSESELFILPSISHEEGFGIVLLEAMAYKTAVIASSIVGSANEIKNSNSGLIVKPKDSIALADAIMRILKNKKLSKTMGENGRQLVKDKYTWKKLTKQFEKIYQEEIL